MTDEDVMALADDCILAAKCMEDTGAFPTGQSVLRDAARALLDARADAKAAVAVVVERAVDVAEAARRAAAGLGPDKVAERIADAIRALAPEDAIAEVERVRAERNAALADVARFQEERTYVIGANDGWDAAVEQSEASPAVEKAMVRFWKKLAETHNERADRLAAELASTNAREAGLTGLIRWAHDTLWELNPSNYDHDEVCKVNDAAVEVILGLAPVIGETHGHSAEWWAERAALAQPSTEGGE